MHSNNLNEIKTNKEDKEEFNSKRKRRSKNDQVGRNFECDICHKTYLSDPALNSHKKSKHSDEIKDPKRGRGRPRKNPTNIAELGTNGSTNFEESFFLKEIRKKGDKADFDIYEQIDLEFDHLFANYYPKIFKDLEKVVDHSISKILNNKNLLSDVLNSNYNNRHTNHNDGETDEANGKDLIILTCDHIMIKYLFEVKEKVNAEYFQFIFKFIVLFRECINCYKDKKRIDVDDNIVVKEFTEVNNAETVPDLCNEFITDFMESNNFFGLDTTELIEIIQHFCFWIYSKGYTQSRLTLLN